MIERARLLYNSGRIGAAQDVLLEALQANPQDGITRAFLAMCYKVQGRYGDAERELHQALADTPNEGYPHYVRAALTLAQHHPKATIEAAREAIQLDPAFTSSYVLMAHAQIDLGRWHEALEPLHQALEVDPESVAALATLANTLRRLNRLEEARRTIESALRIDPLHARSHAIHGWILMDERRFDDALAAFREALSADPYDWEGRQGLVAALKACAPLYRLARRIAPIAAVAALVPAAVALLSARLGALHLAFYALVILSYAAIIAVLFDATATVQSLKRRFGRNSVTRDQRRFATIAAVCIAINWLAFLAWRDATTAGAANAPLYGAVVVGSFGILSGAAFSVRPGITRFWLFLYIVAFCGTAIGVPLALYPEHFHFSNAEDALAAVVIVILATWLSLAAIAWLRRAQ